MKLKYINEKTGEPEPVPFFPERKEIVFNPMQEKFIKTESRFPLFSGGFRSGKSLAMIVKILRHLDVPNNLGLLGRLTYTELRDTVQKQFFEVCPQQLIKRYSRQEESVEMINGSVLLFRHLDTIAENEIRGMNLGFAAIDQIESIPEEVFLALRSRLSRMPVSGYKNQIFGTSNPVMSWCYKYWKQSGDASYELFESSMLDNKDNLPQELIEDALKYPEQWKRTFVYGIWDEIQPESAYFAPEYLKEQDALKKRPIREFEGFKIFEDYQSNDEYQVGVDPSEGSSEDSSGIVVVSKKTCQVVASWKGKIPADALATKVSLIGRKYHDPLVVLEINGIGLATLMALRRIYSNIYKREVFDDSGKHKTEKYGWKTSYANKVLLLDNFLKLLREKNARVNDDLIISEMRTFAWSDEAKKKGLGALQGYHDDMVMATSLAYWGVKGVYQEEEIEGEEPGKNTILGTLYEIQKRNKRDQIIGN